MQISAWLCCREQRGCALELGKELGNAACLTEQTEQRNANKPEQTPIVRAVLRLISLSQTENTAASSTSQEPGVRVTHPLFLLSRHK